MSFLQKFFAHNIHSNKTENELKGGTEPLKSSSLHITKDQIRFLLFRECDRRGRKLLFDSSAVEKISLHHDESSNHQIKKCSISGCKKQSDSIETSTKHGYKYKKVSDDVACFGEMIFGSVAMTYKGENSCKIHKIPSPKKLMFTTIIHAPVRCHISAISECSSESSSTSLKDSFNQRETSSSDSKLYKPAGVVQKCSSTYPCTINAAGLDKLVQCCDVTNAGAGKKSCLSKDSGSTAFDGLSAFNDSGNECSRSKEPKLDIEQDFLILNYSQKISGCDQNSSGNTNSATSFVSSDSENVSSVSGSLSSLRRRWAQSNSTSLDTASQEDVSSTPSRKRTKLGLALVLDMPDSDDDQTEAFLFNHTILIDSIINKLQSTVESAYVKNHNFLDLLYAAFLDTQQSVYDLITSGKYALPFWIGLLGDPDESMPEKKGSSCTGAPKHGFSPPRTAPRDSRFSIKPFASPTKLRKSAQGITTTDQAPSNSAKIQFLNDFHDVLVRFDTKDTNFFVSTLLTAVLTHHLSWVTAIAETDTSNRHEKVQSVIKNYNPIWAQLNDLCGLLGSPLKCAKTIVKGSESKRCYITSIVQVLTYFIRCFNVVENVYDVDIEDVIGEVGKSVEVGNFPGIFRSVFPGESGDNGLGEDTACAVAENDSTAIERVDLTKIRRSGPEGFKRNKTSSSRLNEVEEPGQIYADTKGLMRGVKVAERDFELAREVGVEETNGDAQECYLEGYLSPDEGYNTIDSSKKVDMEVQKSSAGNAKSDIVFLLGDNEELVKVRKGVVEREDLKGKKETACTDEVDSVCRTFEESLDIRQSPKGEKNLEKRSNGSFLLDFLELNMPENIKSSHKKHLQVSSVFGGVNQRYNSEQIIQGLVDPGDEWEDVLQKDLYLCAYNSIVEKNVTEALCIIGDVDSWEVVVRSSRSSRLNRKSLPGVSNSVCMSQLVADMLESFLIIHKINLSPNFCLLHIEKKLREIYLKSKTVAELLISTDLCTIEYLTTRLDVSINDIPLLLSVATTHSPQISDKYGLSFA